MTLWCYRAKSKKHQVRVFCSDKNIMIFPMRFPCAESVANTEIIACCEMDRLNSVAICFCGLFDETLSITWY